MPKNQADEMAGILASITALSGDEREIVLKIIERMNIGRKKYGIWKVDDKRNNIKEALEEVLDALDYVAGRLVELDKCKR